MIELTETLAGNTRVVWIAAWNVLRLREDLKCGTAITMADQNHVHVAQDARHVAQLIWNVMHSIHQGREPE